MAERVTSAANPLIKRIRQLKRPHVRRGDGACWVEGLQPVWRAVEAGVEVEALVVAPELLRKAEARTMVERLGTDGTRVVEVPAELFTRISDRDGPSGLGAVVRAPVPSLGSLGFSARGSTSTSDRGSISDRGSTSDRGSASDRGSNSGLRSTSGQAEARDEVWIALEGVGNPGNLGTIIRTADAASCAGVILIGATCDPGDPAAIKASMGAVFSLPVVHAADLEELFSWAAAAGAAVVATSGGATDTHWTARYPRPLVLLFGAEGPGLSDQALAGADSVVRIPMAGTAESLNLAAAVAVVAYQVQREQLG